MAPVMIKPAPRAICQVKFSPKNMIPKIIAKATLNLSMGATLETGPKLNAR